MKHKVPQEVKDAADALQHNREFKRITLWIFKSLEDTRIENDYLEGIELTIGQGYARVLSKLLKVFEGEEDK